VSEQPAKHLARIRCKFPLWDIRPVEAGHGTGWTARRPEHPNIWAVSLSDLEARLADTRRGSGSSC
jgi:hypothetical protein